MTDGDETPEQRAERIEEERRAEDRKIEEDRRTHDRKVEDARRAHDRMEEWSSQVNEAAINAGALTMRTLALINSGATIGIIALTGNLAGKGHFERGIPRLSESILWFAIGLVFSVVGMAGAYLVNRLHRASADAQVHTWEHPYIKHTVESERISASANLFQWITVAIGFASMGAFIWGLWHAYDVFSTLQSPAKTPVAEAVQPTVGPVNFVMLTGLMFDAVGAFLLAKAVAFNSREKIALQVVSVWDYNKALIPTVVEARLEAGIGLGLLIIGFAIQAASQWCVGTYWTLLIGAGALVAAGVIYLLVRKKLVDRGTKRTVDFLDNVVMKG